MRIEFFPNSHRNKWNNIISWNESNFKIYTKVPVKLCNYLIITEIFRNQIALIRNFTKIFIQIER